MDRVYLNKLTKAMVGYIFRNGIVEDYHADGCLSDSQMKALNKFMVDRLGFALYLLKTRRRDDLNLLLGFHCITCSKWDDIDLSIGKTELRRLKEEIFHQRTE